MPVINKPIQYFAANTWNGSGTSTVTVDFGFQPDLVWIKPRNNVASNANSHILIDSVRGSDKILRSDTTGAEVTESNNIVAFTSTGITIGDSHNVNKNTTSQYVAWAWKKGATQGFDIVTYTGTGVARTVAHSLGVTPSMILIKNRTTATSWLVYHASVGNASALFLNLTNASTASSTYFNNTSPTSSVFSVGTATSGNENASNHVAYLFAEVAGFSKFGSYTGNGSTDGPFIFTGFRPAFVMIKSSSSAGGNWLIQNNKTLGYNPSNSELYANLSNAETTADRTDLLSNGFKPRINSAENNSSGVTYIYAAFAESPFKYALAR